jgi:hypothetical protein
MLEKHTKVSKKQNKKTKIEVKLDKPFGQDDR